jgi:hypothetical protein
MTEVMNTYKMYAQAQKEIKNAKDTKSESYKKLQESYEGLKKLYGEIEDAIDIPPSTVKSLEVLAERAQERVRNVEEDINQLRREIELWFDRSMDRATGVYKRNAKGVAIIIGFLVAAAANADTFHIVSRLSKDSTLPTAITQRASQANIDEVNQALLEIPIPLGRDAINLSQQDEESKDWKNWKIGSWSFRSVKRYLGWLLSGIAISMGASFWFDLLNRVVNVRNAGKPPRSTSDIPASSNKES